MITKEFTYKLDLPLINTFFPHYRIKNKIQILEILLEATRYLLYNLPQPFQNGAGMTLNIKKMSRLFFFNGNKYYSINFPFTFILDNQKIFISYKNIVNIDSQMISGILSILKDNRFNSSFCMDFIEPVSEIENDYNELWTLLRELLIMEDGYLRFDNDPKAYEEAKKNNKEHTHPENHIDIFYSNSNTFKIGLESIIKNSEFIDYLDSQTDCKYLTSFVEKKNKLSHKK